MLRNLSLWSVILNESSLSEIGHVEAERYKSKAARYKLYQSKKYSYLNKNVYIFRIGKCLRCNQADVYEGKNYYLCKHYKNPCTFIMAKDYQGQPITSEHMKKLLKGEEVGLNIASPIGEDYTVILSLDEGYLRTRT